MASFDPKAPVDLANTIPTPFPPFRRIVTTHTSTDTDGSDVALLESTYALTPLLGGRAHAGYVFASKDLPTTSQHSITSSDVEKATDQCSGVVLDNGVNGQVTDLPPNCGVGMHRTSSIDYNIFLKGSAYLITPSKDSKHANGTGHADAKPGEVWTKVSAGEVVVQRGTLHAWKATEEGARWCTVVVSAKAVEVNGEALKDVDFD
ncbi:hypothetical protein BD324DRAFT_583223 [Kockovaella imperatae]|uniref:Cupin type-1 domain-containing protein n=1 Tax=Kockovaella imperatae TaxID=4999 RepID=A0A1Y1U9X6_9TREE|nr:hypothetical protein BD324DRAFT_583223 [Kockovaella imperatae]ORX34812.1 hypothetical protein BD324DRAFT_583223 [Kockovaella imperatae]